MSSKNIADTECITPWVKKNSVQDKTRQAQSARFCYVQIHSSFQVSKRKKTKKNKNETPQKLDPHPENKIHKNDNNKSSKDKSYNTTASLKGRRHLYVQHRIRDAKED